MFKDAQLLSILEAISKAKILACCDSIRMYKVNIKHLFGIFFGKLNGIFVIHHELKKHSSRFVSQE